MQETEENKKLGRPFGTFIGEQKRDRNIGIRVSEKELEEIKARAKAENKKLTQYILDKVLN